MDPAPGIRNLITDIPGIQVGHAEDNKIGTGVTVITGDKPFSAAVDVRGGGPGTRETDMLSLENSIGRADAIVLSGGSAFGLDACSEVQDLLRQDNKGYKVGKAIVPLVPGAVIFDLNINDNPHVNVAILDLVLEVVFFDERFRDKRSKYPHVLWVIQRRREVEILGV